MKKRALPVTVTTLEALLTCVAVGNSLIYMNGLFFEGYRPEISQILHKHGYVWTDFHARNGVFYAKDLDPNQWFVADPYGIY